MAEAGRAAGAGARWRAGRAGRAAGRWWLRHGLGPVLLHWWRRRGLRARVTITAALGLVVAFAAADLLLFNALRVSLTRSVDDYARSGASQVAALINANRLPDPVPVAAGTITIQVLDSAGDITDASPDADLLVPVVSAAQARALADGGGALLIRGAPFDMPSLLRVAAVRADDGQLVIAAVPFSAASGSLNVVARALVIFTPVLFLAFTGAIWLVTGSTLRPIGALRRGAARVTETGVPADLPVPEARDEVKVAGADPQRHALPAGGGAAAAAGPGLRHGARAAVADRVDQDAARGGARLPRRAGLGDDGAGRARGRAAAGPARRGPAAARPARRAGRGRGERGWGERGWRARTAAGRPTTRAGAMPRRTWLSLGRSVACRYCDARVPVTVMPPGTDPGLASQARRCWRSATRAAWNGSW